MTMPRAWHTATLLNNGKVLIAGGAAAAAAELYDPDNGTFTPAGNMTTPRSRHTATLLVDGRVLIAGGITSPEGGSPINSAELYDPSIGTFAPTGNMISGHGCHQATLLGNGKVLITGGSDESGVGSPINELFDIATGKFAQAGPYARYKRDFNTCQAAVSTLLADGRALIFWEETGAELFDAATGSFASTGSPIESSYNDGLPTATLLPNGKVLVAGGADDTAFGPDGVGYTNAELYDSLTGTFAATGSMITGHVLHTATLLSDGTVLIAGAFWFPGAGARAEIYDPVTSTFTATANMLTPRGGGQTATLLRNGQVLVTGGDSPYPNVTSKAEIYRPTLLAPPPLLLSAPDSQPAILHAATHQLVSAGDPAVAGEALEIYLTGLIDGSVIPPQVAIGGRMAEILWFARAPGYDNLNQINVRVPGDVAPGPAVPVRLNYLGRPSNEVSIAVQ